MKKGVTRRQFLKTGGFTLGTLVLSPYSKFTDNIAWAIKPFPPEIIVNITELKTGQLISFNYPDKESPAVLAKLGEKVIGGIGKDKDIIAYSLLCTHKGCAVTYKPDKTFVCPCHMTKFDLTKNGQVVIGQATVNLPQIALEITPQKDIKATGIKTVMYGKFSDVKMSQG